MSKTHSVLEPMDIVVIYTLGGHNERRFRVSPELTDALYDLLVRRKRFWEWERDLKWMRKITAAQAATIKGLWQLLGYTKEERTSLLKRRDKIEKE